jgi:hypothetical protein
MKHFSPYDAVAEDYYDATLHPTCANFRELGIRGALDLLTSGELISFIERAEILETGSGRSSVMEIAEKFNFAPDNLTIQDASRDMLSHSKRWQNRLRDMLVYDARHSPFPDATFDGIFSFLADPYNDDRLWRELSRIIKSGGFWITTLPSHNWAKNFRDVVSLNESQFVTRDGVKVDLPSYTYSPSELIKGLERFGFEIANYRAYSTSEIEGYVSPKLLTDERHGPVVDCYLFKRL